MPVFASGVVLLLKFWGGIQHGLVTDTNKDLADIHKCMIVLKSMEARLADVPTCASCMLMCELYSDGIRRVNFGKLCCNRLFTMVVEYKISSDVLSSLMSVRDIPLPQPAPVTRNKRRRDDDNSSSNTESSSTSSSLAPDERRNSEDEWNTLPNASSSECSPAGSERRVPTPLPVYTEELGQSDFTSTFDNFATDFSNPPAYPVPDGVFDDGGLSSVLSINNSSLFDSIHQADPGYIDPFQSPRPLSSSSGSWATLLQPFFPIGSDPDAQIGVVENDPLSMWSHAPTSLGCVLSPCRMYAH